MAEELIKDFKGAIIARVETKPNGDKEIRDFHRRKLGTYDKAQNVTRDFYGRVIARGECIGLLIK